MLDLEFNHLGLATRHLDRAQAVFRGLGYTVSDPMFVPPQKVKVCFARREGHPTVELIAPVGEDSPVKVILDKSGSSPYHLCYTTQDLDAALAWMTVQKFRVIGEIFISNALSDQRTCFLYNANTGLMELTEARP